MDSVIRFVKNEIVLVISAVLALISCFVVHPDAMYISYIDFRTLSILLSLMLVMAGLQALGVFRQVGEALVGRVSSTRGLALVLILLCFVSSMIITNDVALITFVPFTIVVLTVAVHTELLIPVIVLETIAANLGSMTTPIGNPQNLYLYALSEMSFLAFLKLMVPYSFLSLLLLLISAFIAVKNKQVPAPSVTEYTRTRREQMKLIIYACLFIVSLLVVARLIHFVIGLVIVVVAVLVFDRRILTKADFSLLLTFVCLFIFIGNMKRIEAISAFLASIVGGREVLAAVVASQCISNVPAAILLSGFTDNIRELIIGTNMGGLGTLIASMASLISFKQYGYIEHANKGKYLGVFTIYNIIFLVILYGGYCLVGRF